MPRTEFKPLAWYKPDPDQPRKHFDEADLRQLGASLKKKQLQPILTQPDGTIIAGERRWRAAVYAELEGLEAKIADTQLSGAEVKVWQLVENMQRADLTAYEQWVACAELMCMEPTRQLKDLAEMLNKDASTVTRLLSPSKCTQEWQDALRDGKVGISDCYAASKLPLDKQAGLLALKLSGATRDQIEAAGKKARNGHASQVKQARVSVPLTTGTRIVVTGPEMTLDDLIEALQAALEAARKANKDSLDVKTAEKVWRDKAKVGM